jgi:hypothetical protein
MPSTIPTPTLIAAQQALNLPERHNLQTRADAVQLSPDPPDA